MQLYLSTAKKFIRFDGFNDSDFSTIAAAFKERYGCEIIEVPMSTYGLNLGDLELDNDRKTLELKFKDMTVAEVPYNRISQCALPSKNEVEIQFEDDDTAERTDEVLVQMRLYIPFDEDGNDPSEEIQQKIIQKAEIKGASGNVLCALNETVGSFLTPRGKYAVDLYDKYFTMVGKTYNYKITYNSISKIFLLEHVYGTYFVISLNRPISQGQQRYPHLVMQLSDKDEELELNLTAEEIEERYDNQLSPKLEGPLPQIVARVFKTLTQKKVFIPGSFRSAKEMKCVKCALKASNGYLYPLNQSFFFVHKPATFIRYEDISSVEFLKLDTDPAKGVVNNFFDFEVSLKKEASLATEKYMFNNLKKSEFSNLLSYFKKKGIHVRHLSRVEQSLRNMNAPKMTPKTTNYAMDVDSDSEDSDFDEDKVELSSSSSEESEDGDSSDSDKDEVKKQPKKKQKISEGNGAKATATSTSTTTKKKKRKSKKKDPKFPKRPRSAYLFFSTSKGKELKEQNPTMPQPEIMKKCGELWQALSEEDRKPFVKSSDEDKERFNKEIAAYEPSEGFDKKGKAIE